MTLQSVFSSTTIALTRRIYFLFAFIRPVACGAWALWVVALVDFGICVAQFNGNVTLQLVLETNCLYPRDGLDYRTFAVSDVANGADVNGSLAGNNFGR